MDPSQRRVVALAAYAIAIVLLLFFFATPLWQWATWDAHHNTLDLGFLKVTTRPAFPSDAKAIGLGLIVPIVLAAIGRIVEGPRAK
jgi:hypothetical protein